MEQIGYIVSHEPEPPSDQAALCLKYSDNGHIMAKARITLGECLEGIDKELEESSDGIVPGFMALSLVRDLLKVTEEPGELRWPVSGGEACPRPIIPRVALLLREPD